MGFSCYLGVLCAVRLGSKLVGIIDNNGHVSDYFFGGTVVRVAFEC